MLTYYKLKVNLKSRNYTLPEDTSTDCKILLCNKTSYSYPVEKTSR